MTFIDPIASQRDAFRRDAIDLLTLKRGGHAGRWAYDESWGEFVKDNPLYHVFNEECGLFALNAEELAARAGRLATATDIGAGSREAFVRKLLPVLARMPGLRELISIDLCDAFPAATAEVAGRWLPRTRLTPLAVDFLAAMPALTEPTLAFFVGSSISNIVLGAGETLQDGVARTLTWFGNALPPGSKLLLSYDRCHDATRLARAYNHPALNAMERSIIGRMNRELGLTGLSGDDVRVVDAWYPERHRWAKELELQRPVDFSLAGVEGHLAGGQRLWTGSCYKIPDAIMTAAAAQSPLRPEWHADGPNMRLLLLGR